MPPRIAFMVVSFLSLSAVPALALVGPDESLTPGVLCRTGDADFAGLYYGERIARCTRNISPQEKLKVAEAYGNLPKSEWKNYEFDHLIPLCAGGANDIRNLWPQPIAEAHEKDKLEDHVCNEMKAGRLLQSEAVQLVHEWFNARSEE